MGVWNRINWALLVFVVGCSGWSAHSYWGARSHPTHLSRRGPAPTKTVKLRPPPWAKASSYHSDGRELKAWLVRPPDLRGDAPAVVFLHSGFAVQNGTFARVRPLIDRGLVVFIPTYRGEQGNSGDFELLVGEVADAAAAVRHVAELPGVNAERVYVVGHSVGGAVAALLSLWHDLPLKGTASIGGIYSADTFERWYASSARRRLVRFDPGDPQEVSRRILGPHLDEMQVSHIAYVGHEDEHVLLAAMQLQRQAQELEAPFEVALVGGDHEGSLHHGLAAYLRRIASDGSP